MKVVTIIGSPRESGNTATVLGWVEEELKRLGHEVEHVSTIGKKIGGCLECYKCQAPDTRFVCAQKDDANAILESIRGSDAWVIATPLFCWGFSGQIKPLIDRLFCLADGYMMRERRSSVEGNPVAMVATCAGPIEGNADLLIEAFNHLANYLKGNVAGTVVATGCTPTRAPDDEAREEARKLAQAIAGSSN